METPLTILRLPLFSRLSERRFGKRRQLVFLSRSLTLYLLESHNRQELRLHRGPDRLYLEVMKNGHQVCMVELPPDKARVLSSALHKEAALLQAVLLAQLGQVVTGKR